MAARGREEEKAPQQPAEEEREAEEADKVEAAPGWG